MKYLLPFFALLGLIYHLPGCNHSSSRPSWVGEWQCLDSTSTYDFAADGHFYHTCVTGDFTGYWYLSDEQILFVAFDNNTEDPADDLTLQIHILDSQSRDTLTLQAIFIGMEHQETITLHRR